MRVLLLAAFALTACSGQSNPDGESPGALADENGVEESAASSTISSAPTTLAGAWRVAGIDGEPLDETYGLALEANGTQIWWEPRCAGVIWTYTIDGNAFASDSYTDPAYRPEPGAPPPPVCAIALPPRLSDVAFAIQSADRIEETPGRAIVISGPDHSVTLYSQ